MLPLPWFRSHAFVGRQDSMVFATLAFLGAFGADQGSLTYFADLSGPGLPYAFSLIQVTLSVCLRNVKLSCVLFTILMV